MGVKVLLMVKIKMSLKIKNGMKNPEKYKKQFGKYQANDVNSAGLEELYTSVHKAIRADPAAQKKTPSVPAGEKPKAYNKQRLSYSQRKDRIRQKLASAAKKNA